MNMNHAPNGVETRRQRGVDRRHTGLRHMKEADRVALRERATKNALNYDDQLAEERALKEAAEWAADCQDGED